MINYILFTAGAILLFVTFRVTRILNFRVRSLRKFYPFLVAIELIVWMTFLFWLINFFFKNKSYYNELILVLVVTLVILLVWFYIKDVVAGFLFRIMHNPTVEQLIYSDEAEGVIKKMAPSQIFVEHEGGEIIRIPYSRLMGKSLSLKTADARSASEVTFRLELGQEMDHLSLEKKIKLALLQSPWCVPNKPIKFTFPEDASKGIEITIHLLDKSYAEAAKSKVNQLLVGQP